MTPETKARQQIDQKLEQAGWTIQDMKQLNLGAAVGVAVREYPTSTEEQAILSQLADRNCVTLRIYHRLVESMEQRKIIQNATRKNKLKSSCMESR